MKKPFDPNDFFDTPTIEDILDKLDTIKDLDFKEYSLNDELVKLNYEIVSPEYEDKKYSSLEDYYTLEVDTVV